MIAHTTSLAVSGGVYLLAQTALTSRLGDRLENRRDALLAASKLVGGIHALSVGSAALRILVDPKWQHNDLVQTPSREGNRIVAWELGYLLSGALLAMYLRAAHQGWAKGAFFVTSFMIMNLSTPLRYLIWYFKKFGRASDHTISKLHILAMTVYAGARFALVYYLLWVHGQRKGLTAFGAFKSLPKICRTSTTILVLSNAIRFLQVASQRRKALK